MSDHSLFSAHIAHQKERLDHLLNDAGYDVLFIHSGRVAYPRFDDRAQPFRVHGHFNAWVPMPYASDCLLALRAGQKPQLWYLQADDFWHIPPAEPAHWWAKEFDVHLVSDPKAWAKAFDTQEAIAAIGTEAHLAGLGDHIDINPSKLLIALDEMRTQKTPWECACIKSASEWAAKAHLAAAQSFSERGSELALFYAYMQALDLDPATLPYDAIVALNEHAATLHYQHRDAAKPEHHYSFLLDAGADCMGYAADITRTHLGPSSHAQAGLFQGLIDAMEHLERRLAMEATDGQSFVSLHMAAHQGIADILRQTELASGSTESLVEQGITRVFFPHGLGHFLGAQVHDVAGQINPCGESLPPPPTDPMLRLTRSLEVGNVVTIEPGLYFIPTLLQKLKETPAGTAVNWPLVAELMPFGGIRIEDNVLVTDGAPVNFTRQAFDHVS